VFNHSPLEKDKIERDVQKAFFFIKNLLALYIIAMGEKFETFRGNNIKEK